MSNAFLKSPRGPHSRLLNCAPCDRYHRAAFAAEALRESGNERAIPLGEALLLHQVFALLKQERERQQVTLAELENRTGISQAALSRYENGKSVNPTIETLYRIAAALGKQIGCFLQDVRPPRSRTS